MLRVVLLPYCAYITSHPSAVRELAGCSLHNPLYIDAVAEGPEATEAVRSGKKRACEQTPSQLEQFCSVVPCKLRLVTLAACLLHHCSVSVCMYIRMYVCMYVSMYCMMHLCVCMYDGRQMDIQWQSAYGVPYMQCFLSLSISSHSQELKQKVIVFFISRQVVEFHYHLFTETLDEGM